VVSPHKFVYHDLYIQFPKTRAQVVCHAVAEDATEAQKLDCAKLEGGACQDACTLSTMSKVVLTLGQDGSAFQLYASVRARSS
jgi:hypothetical protein